MLAHVAKGQTLGSVAFTRRHLPRQFFNRHQTTPQDGGTAMATIREPMDDKTFYGYMYPLQNRRYYLALGFSIILFPLIAAGLIAGTIFLIVPAAALLLWLGMRIFFANMLGNSILVSRENFPRINTIAEETKATLGYTKPIYIFVYQQGDFNAYMKHFFFRRAIFLNSELLQSGVSDSEARWIVARFVGYMRARQQAGVLGWVIRAAQHLMVFNFFILPYERAMVYTGDRLALVEIDGDLVSAISAMQKLLVGRELGYSVNPEGLIAQHRQVKGSLFAFLARMGTGFPHTTARYVDLILFAKAFFPDQYKTFEAANPGLPADLAQLGRSQQTDSGVPREASAPKGWTWAGATSVVLLLLGLAVGNIITSGPNLAGFSVPATLAPDTSVPATATLPPPPPNTHYNAIGQVEPDAGCSWMTNDATDLRVVCR